ncbi:MAG TPA: SigB/SigF/SigG family RNA polymerase sigma factor [Actinocatenispora sp.]
MRPADPRRKALRTRVIEGLVPLADRLALRYANRGERSDDLVQVARLGLIKAVDGFDPARGDFLGYAVPTIQGELKRYFRDQCWDVRVPRRLQDLRHDANAAADRLSQRVGHEPSVAELAADLAVPERDVLAAIGAGAAYRVASLNAATRQDGAGCEIGELVGAPDHRVEEVPDRVSLRPALARLPARERRVLALRFVDGLTQAEIAERIGLSQMHVSRVLSRTLAGLRAWIDGDASAVDVCGQRRRSLAA